MRKRSVGGVLPDAPPLTPFPDTPPLTPFPNARTEGSFPRKFQYKKRNGIPFLICIYVRLFVSDDDTVDPIEVLA